MHSRVPGSADSSDQRQADDGSQDRYERFVLLFARTEPTLHSYLLSLLANWDDAEEVLQQVSLILWRKFDDYEPGTNFKSWACAIARFEALNYRKKHRRDPHQFSDALTSVMAEEAAEDFERLESERKALATCLGELKPDDRRVVERCYTQDAPINQLADEFNCTTNSLYKRLNRLRARLLQCIRKRMALEGSR